MNRNGGGAVASRPQRTLLAQLRAPGPGAVRTVKAVAFVLALLPLARLVAGFFLDRLGANPIELITRSTGTWTLSFLLITLGVTPLRRITGMHWLSKLRRMLGLFAFFYACLHFTTYLWFDQFFDWPAIWKDIMKRRFIWIGFTAFVLLTPLAATSNDAAMRKLGGTAWQRLHRLVYVIAVCGVIHYCWLVKKDLTQPVIYAVVLALLLAFRLAYRIRRRSPADDRGGVRRIDFRETFRVTSSLRSGEHPSGSPKA